MDRRRTKFTFYPLTMFEKSNLADFGCFLQPLTNNKWPLGIDPGGHHFVVLNISINKKPFFFSEVVIFEKKHISRFIHNFSTSPSHDIV